MVVIPRLRQKTVKKGHQRGLSAVPTITAATTATNCFTTTLSWNRPDLRTLFVPPLPPRFHGTYQAATSMSCRLLMPPRYQCAVEIVFPTSMHCYTYTASGPLVVTLLDCLEPLNTGKRVAAPALARRGSTAKIAAGAPSYLAPPRINLCGASQFKAT